MAEKWTAEDEALFLRLTSQAAEEARRYYSRRTPEREEPSPRFQSPGDNYGAQASAYAGAPGETSVHGANMEPPHAEEPSIPPKAAPSSPDQRDDTFGFHSQKKHGGEVAAPLSQTQREKPGADSFENKEENASRPASGAQTQERESQMWGASQQQRQKSLEQNVSGASDQPHRWEEKQEGMSGEREPFYPPKEDRGQGRREGQNGSGTSGPYSPAESRQQRHLSTADRPHGGKNAASFQSGEGEGLLGSISKMFHQMDQEALLIAAVLLLLYQKQADRKLILALVYILLG